MILTQNHMDDVKGEDIDGEQRQGECEQVEISVISLADTVSDPGAVMVEAVWGKDVKEKNL